MVKAGVFLLLRLSPAMAGSQLGTAVALVGLLTFLFASLVATTESNVKKVLAWSTIANLGLVVGCAGVATPATLWVGMLIIVFHAAAKSLLFLVVGTLENRLYSKDLEAWDNLLSRFPRVSLLALVGVAGMFLAPFGIVLAKWAAIKAFLEVPGWRGAAYLVIMAYGSALTIYAWSKLLLKILAMRAIPAAERAIEARVTREEWFAEGALAALVLALTFGIGLLSESVAGPFALHAFGEAPRSLLHLSPVTVIVLALAVLALPALALRAGRLGHADGADIYVGGRTVDAAHRVGTASGGSEPVSLRNYYLKGVVDGPRVFRAGTALCGAVVLVAVVLQVLA
jgi:ech hydrogenase subunit A